MDTFVTFQRYNAREQIQESAALLAENGIETLIEDDSAAFDATFANNAFAREYRLKLRPADFEKAHRLLEALLEEQLHHIDRDYYLFGFSEDELTEILTKPDEWGKLDYVLAQKILKERGKEITPQAAQALKNQRVTQLAKPAENRPAWIAAGYVFAFLGGFLGLVIGFTMANNKKTLPDGSVRYVHTATDRKHGWIIFGIGTVTFIGGLLLRAFRYL